jgi:hypothetical protein
VHRRFVVFARQGTVATRSQGLTPLHQSTIKPEEWRQVHQTMVLTDPFEQANVSSEHTEPHLQLTQHLLTQVLPGHVLVACVSIK